MGRSLRLPGRRKRLLELPVLLKLNIVRETFQTFRNKSFVQLGLVLQF